MLGAKIKSGCGIPIPFCIFIFLKFNKNTVGQKSILKNKGGGTEMNKRMMLLVVQSLLVAMLFSGSALSATAAADADHTISTDLHGCWLNEKENSIGHYDDETGYWIELKTLMK